MCQRGKRAGGVPLVAGVGYRLENTRLTASWIFSTWILAAWILAAWILTARVFTARVFTPWVLTARILTTRVFTPRILSAGLFLRDGEIDSVGALFQCHVQKGGFGDGPGELAVNSPVGG